MTHRNTAIAILILTGLGWCAHASAADLGGRVTDSQGFPLGDVTISLGAGGQRVTGGNGLYQFTAVLPGQYTLIASTAGFQSLTRSVALSDAAPVTVDLALAPAFFASVGGRVFEPTGAPLPGAQVAVTHPTGRSYHAAADSAGSYLVGGIIPGDGYTVRALSPGLAAIPAVVDLMTPVPGFANLYLSSTSRLEVRVRDSRDAPVSGANVFVQRDGANVAAVPTDAAGLAAFTTLAGGDYVLAVTHQSFYPAQKAVTLSSFATYRVDFQLGFVGRGSVSGLVQDRLSSQPVAGAHVGIPEMGATAVTDSRGYFSLSQLPSATARLQVAVRGRLVWDRAVEITQSSQNLGVILVDVPAASGLVLNRSVVNLRAGNSLSVDRDPREGPPARLEIYDARGRLVLSRDGLGAADLPLRWFGRDQADVPLPAGVYTLRLLNADGPRSARILLLH